MQQPSFRTSSTKIKRWKIHQESQRWNRRTGLVNKKGKKQTQEAWLRGGFLLLVCCTLFQHDTVRHIKAIVSQASATEFPWVSPAESQRRNLDLNMSRMHGKQACDSWCRRVHFLPSDLTPPHTLPPPVCSCCDLTPASKHDLPQRLACFLETREATPADQRRRCSVSQVHLVWVEESGLTIAHMRTTLKEKF